MTQQGDLREQPTLVGHVLAGRYRVERRIAEGGFSVVYLAHQDALQRPVAIKVLKREERGESPSDFRERFAAEGVLMAKLRHPNIVSVYDFGMETLPEGREAPWLALEWLDGETLESQLAARRGSGGRSPAEALALLRPVLEALAHAHHQGIAHRDLKPGNIMVVPSDRGSTLRVVDFGIAKVMAEEEDVGTGRTRTSGRPAYTPGYAAPEQITHSRTGPWTDVHALGLILTEVLTDEPPFEGRGSDLLERIISAQRPTPRARGKSCGPWDDVLDKAVALSPSQRWRDAGELLHALEAALDGHLVFARHGAATVIARSTDSFAPPRAALDASADPRPHRLGIERALVALVAALVVALAAGAWLLTTAR